MMGPSPQCYIPGHKVIGPLVMEKKIFEGLLPYMGMTAILVCDPDPVIKLSFPHPTEAHMKFGFDRPSGFEDEDL